MSLLETLKWHQAAPPGYEWVSGQLTYVGARTSPASPAKSEEPGLPTMQGLPTHALVASLTLLVQAIGEQTQAINRLADSNRDLVQAMAEDSGMDGDDEPKGYLNARTL